MIKQKLNIITLGCPKNSADSEILAKQIENSNFNIVNVPQNADIVIINTCGFIKDAKEESLDKIFEMISLKESGTIKKLYVMGCLYQRYKNELEEQIEGVDGFFGIDEFKNILNKLGGKLNYRNIFEHKLEYPYYTFLKISDGCDHPCSFCAIPYIKGRYKSKSISLIIKEAKSLIQEGVKEINLVAQDSTYYGMDLYGEKRLPELMKKLLIINSNTWFRLMYAYPTKFPYEILDIMLEFKNFCKYIDIPIQHISDKILKLMRRGITKKATMKLIERIRDTIPGITLRTSLIVGYPGETKKDFNELLKFVEEVKFERLGVFTYSPEDHTHANKLSDNISASEKELRKGLIMETQRSISAKNNEKLLNKNIKIFIDSQDNNNYFGRTEGDAPEIDNRVILNKKHFISKKTDMLGKFITGKIYKCSDYDLYANPLITP